VDVAASVIATVEATLRELHAGDPELPPVLLSSVLDRDLGFDSLGRMELLLRTERACGVDLPADTLQRAETVADLLGAVQRARLQPGVGPTQVAGAAGHALPGPLITPAPSDAATGQTGPPVHASTLLDVLAWQVQRHPEQTQLVVLADDTQEGGERRISYRQLADASAAIGGSRELLPAGRWWPRRASLQVDVCAPILPAAQAAGQAPELFAVAVKLREASRRAIAGHLDGA